MKKFVSFMPFALALVGQSASAGTCQAEAVALLIDKLNDPGFHEWTAQAKGGQTHIAFRSTPEFIARGGRPYQAGDVFTRKTYETYYFHQILSSAGTVAKKPYYVVTVDKSNRCAYVEGGKVKH